MEEPLEKINVLLMGSEIIPYIIDSLSSRDLIKLSDNNNNYSKTIEIDSKKKVKLVVFDAKEIKNFTKENIDNLCNNPSAFALIDNIKKGISIQNETLKNWINDVNNNYPNAVKAIVWAYPSVSGIQKEDEKKMSEFAKQNGALFKVVDIDVPKKLDEFFIEIAKKVLKPKGGCCCSCFN